MIAHQIMPASMVVNSMLIMITAPHMYQLSLQMGTRFLLLHQLIYSEFATSKRKIGINVFSFSFGIGKTGKRTGILFNSGLNDFAVPNLINYFGLRSSPSNYICPGKRSVSSMSPSILTDIDGEVQMVIGAAGGTKIITSVALVCSSIIE